RIFSKRTVRAIVAAQRGQRNKNFLRKADRLPFSLFAHLRSYREQLQQRGVFRQSQRFFARHTAATRSFLQQRINISCCDSGRHANLPTSALRKKPAPHEGCGTGTISVWSKIVARFDFPKPLQRIKLGVRSDRPRPSLEVVP